MQVCLILLPLLYYFFMTSPAHPLSTLEKDIQIVATLIEVNSHNFTKPSNELEQHLSELRTAADACRILETP
jgi:hypothetical protein